MKDGRCNPRGVFHNTPDPRSGATVVAGAEWRGAQRGSTDGHTAVLQNPPGDSVERVTAAPTKHLRSGGGRTFVVAFRRSISSVDVAA